MNMGALGIHKNMELGDIIMCGVIYRLMLLIPQNLVLFSNSNYFYGQVIVLQSSLKFK